ncbi:MAG: putative acyltransferase, partial [Phenylobacterium sp.]|nr:putative acyltransferase [Phenylobacterium sp.]
HGLAISAAVRGLQNLGLTAPVPVFVVSVATGVVVGLLAYQLAEKPLMRLFRTGMASRRPGPALAPGVAPAQKS